jgi:hypothetical protein
MALSSYRSLPSLSKQAGADQIRQQFEQLNTPGSRDSAPPLSGAARDEACKERNRLLLDLLAIEQRLLKKKQSS